MNYNPNSLYIAMNRGLWLFSILPCPKMRWRCYLYKFPKHHERGSLWEIVYVLAQNPFINKSVDQNKYGSLSSANTAVTCLEISQITLFVMLLQHSNV